jgi:hypothetical protein
MNAEFLKKEFINKYVALGPEKFYNALLFYSVKRLVSSDEDKTKLPINLELLDHSEQLIILYRREGDENCLEAAKICRRAAHKIYRVMLKKNLTPRNNKFLNLV